MTFRMVKEGRIIDKPKALTGQTLSERLLPLINDLCSASAVTNDLCTVGNLILDLAVSHTGARRGSLMLLDESNRLSILASRGIALELHDGPPVRIGEGVAGLVAQRMCPVLVRDIRTETLYGSSHRDRYKTDSFISCPIVSARKLMGVLNLSDKETGDPFSEDDFELLKIISNQAAVAIENALLVDQLRVKTDELLEINRKLVGNDIAKTEFITRASHELRTPLNSMKGAIHYLELSGSVPVKRQRLFHSIISQETTKLIQTVEGLLDFLRAEDDCKVVERDLLSLPDILREAVRSPSLNRHLAHKGVTVTIESGESVSAVVGNRIRITQTLTNLIEALASSLGEGERLRVIVTENDSVAIRMELGREIPPEILRELAMKEFSFLEGQSECLLRLHLAMRVVESHHWRLSADPPDRPDAILLKIPKSCDLTVEATVSSVLRRMVELIAALAGARSCSVMLRDDQGDHVVRSAVVPQDYPIGDADARRQYTSSEKIVTEGTLPFPQKSERNGRSRKTGPSGYNSKTLISVLLTIGSKALGVMNVSHRKDGRPFTEGDRAIARTAALRVTGFLNNVYSRRYGEPDLREISRSLDRLLQAGRSSGPRDHRLQELLSLLLEKLGATEEETTVAHYAAALCDLGMSHMHETLSDRKDLLPAEQRILRLHPYSTVSLLGRFESSETLKSVILHHHEHWDGTGYPEGLRSTEIPFLSRVIAVVNAFCAMVAERPHRPALSASEALVEIRRGSGSRYDPQVVKAFLEATAAWLEAQGRYSSAAARP